MMTTIFDWQSIEGLCALGGFFVWMGVSDMIHPRGLAWIFWVLSLTYLGLFFSLFFDWSTTHWFHEILPCVSSLTGLTLMIWRRMQRARRKWFHVHFDGG